MVAVTAVTINGTGNAITGATYSSSALTLTKGNITTTQAVTAVTVTGTGNSVVDASYTNSALTLTKGNSVICESGSTGVPVITKIVSITESDYNNLATKDAATLYVVVPDAN